MVSGNNLKYIYEYIEQKKGLRGLTEFHDLVNQNNVIVPRPEAILVDDEYSSGYLERFLNASFITLSDEKLIFEFGKKYGDKFSKISLKLFSMIESNKRIIESIKDDIEKNMPLIKVSIEELSDKKFVINIKNVKTKELNSFLDGYLDSLFSRIQKKMIKMDENIPEGKKIIVKFM